MSDSATPAAPPLTLQQEARVMKRERLMAERETVDETKFPVPVQELLAHYEQLYAGAISDLLREHCLLNESIPDYLILLRENRTLAGIAFTV